MQQMQTMSSENQKDLQDVLQEWVTIAQVHQAIGVNQKTVLRVVLRAHAARQDWVKLEAYPATGDRAKWLINTASPQYRAHEKRWRDLVQAKEAAQTSVLSEVERETESDDRVQTVWADLCSWLAEQGLVVYVNVIAQQQDWQWSWFDIVGSGYPDAHAAILAALQYQLLCGMPLPPEMNDAAEHVEDGIALDLASLSDPPASFTSLWNQLEASTQQKSSPSFWSKLFPKGLRFR